MVLSLDGIHKSFKDGENELSVLKNISLTVDAGEMIAIMGRSGCGKTTLLNIMSLLMKPDCGNYHIKNRNVDFSSTREMDYMRRNNLGIIVQNFALIGRKTAAENIILPIKGMYENHQVEDMLEDMLEKLDLKKQKNKYPAQLSGGEKQRVAIARAIINKPDVVLADEPTGSLDYKNAQNVMSILQDISEKQGTSVILATHDSMIASQCNHILHMQYGELGDALCNSIEQ